MILEVSDEVRATYDSIFASLRSLSCSEDVGLFIRMQLNFPLATDKVGQVYVGNDGGIKANHQIPLYLTASEISEYHLLAQGRGIQTLLTGPFDCTVQTPLGKERPTLPICAKNKHKDVIANLDTLPLRALIRLEYFPAQIAYGKLCADYHNSQEPIPDPIIDVQSVPLEGSFDFAIGDFTSLSPDDRQVVFGIPQLVA